VKLLRERQGPQMKATKRAMTDVLPYALPTPAGLLALLLALAVDRWWERFDAWVERGRHSGDSNGGQI